MLTQLPINASQIAQCSSEHPRKCRAKGIAHSLGEGNLKGYVTTYVTKTSLKPLRYL
jgi:hypothetical protein